MGKKNYHDGIFWQWERRQARTNPHLPLDTLPWLWHNKEVKGAGDFSPATLRWPYSRSLERASLTRATM
jgi:hypothetical protein